MWSVYPSVGLISAIIVVTASYCSFKVIARLYFSKDVKCIQMCLHALPEINLEMFKLVACVQVPVTIDSFVGLLPRTNVHSVQRGGPFIEEKQVVQEFDKGY